MPRWIKEDASSGAKYLRKWIKTPKGEEYRKRKTEYAREWRKKNRERFKTNQKRAMNKARLEVLTHYSNGTLKCACCGESGLPFLTIDHTKGDGAKHRRELGMTQGSPDQVQREGQKVTMSGTGFIYWLKKNNYPEGFQVLCANCNFAKRQNPICPHQSANK